MFRLQRRSRTSRLLFNWIEFVMGTPFTIDIEMGGIEGILAESDKWDWRLVREYIVPQLGIGMLEKMEHYRDEIMSHAPPESITRDSTPREKELRRRLEAGNAVIYNTITDKAFILWAEKEICTSPFIVVSITPNILGAITLLAITTNTSRGIKHNTVRLEYKY